MNVKEYIQSGIIESYVLGLATDAEQQEFERMCADYPEIAAARDAFERSLEEQLLTDAVAPPAFVKERVFEAVKPSVTQNGVEEIHDTPVRRMNPWKWIAAASIILLVGAGFWAFTTNKKYNDLVAKQAGMEQQLQESTAQLQTLQQEVETIRKPMQVVSLKGTGAAPQAQTTIFWDTTGAAKDVYMLINNLPQPPSEMQYQLWALLDGQPIDLGVFDFDVRQKRLLVKMKNVQNAQAFAITLERRGRPNQEKPEGEIYVVGNL